jgi:hypothetical protein
VTSESLPRDRSPIAVPSGYVAGACNIGPYEIRRRRAFGVAGVAAAALLGAALLAIGAPPSARLLVALPLIGGVFSMLQARRRFCAGFAVAGLSNFGADDTGRRAVTDPGARRADRLAALRMGVDATLIGLPAVVLFILLPLSLR